MVELVLYSYEELLQQTAFKKLACFGAGQDFHRFVSNYKDGGIEEKIDVVIDNNAEKTIISNNKDYPVITLKQFAKIYRNDYIVMITSSDYFDEMITQIETFAELDKITCLFFKLLLPELVNYISNVTTGTILDDLLHTKCQKSQNKCKRKIAYLANHIGACGTLPGVFSKIRNHISLFELNGMSVEMYNINNCVTNKWQHIPYGYDVYYIRIYNEPTDEAFVSFCETVKKINSKSKIILEFPSFSRDDLTSTVPLDSIVSDNEDYSRLRFCIDKIVSYSKDENIWGIPTIRMVNGIEVEAISPRQIKCKQNSICVIAVASFNYWHGYDRFLEGLGVYYSKGGERDIKLHMVGDGVIVSQYIEIIKKYSLNKRVFMHGIKAGEDLNTIYNRCNIAIESFGNHRRGLTLSSSLKTREYVAKGLPIAGGSEVDIFNDDYPYYLEFPADETPIDINEIIGFYDRVYPNHKNYGFVNKTIRNFAKYTCDISITMKPVVEYIESIEAFAQD
ncbi:MAG: hypothetical protein LBC96_10320 [Lachnospiraceae bacterium]|nr:hypothetical protein [Lachnospiraceae bacterium]